MRRQILDRLVELEVLVQQAERDTTIKVTDQEVLDQVEQTYQNVRKQFSTENDFRDQIRQARFGSVEEWRRWLADEQRRQLYAQRLIEAQRQKGSCARFRRPMRRCANSGSRTRNSSRSAPRRFRSGRSSSSLCPIRPPGSVRCSSPSRSSWSCDIPALILPPRRSGFPR